MIIGKFWNHYKARKKLFRNISDFICFDNVFENINFTFLTDSTKIHSRHKIRRNEDTNDAGGNDVIEIDQKSPIDYPKALAFSLSSSSELSTDELTDSSFDTYDGSFFESSPEKSCSKELISSFESIPDLPSSSLSVKSLEFCWLKEIFHFT